MTDYTKDYQKWHSDLMKYPYGRQLLISKDEQEREAMYIKLTGQSPFTDGSFHRDLQEMDEDFIRETHRNVVIFGIAMAALAFLAAWLIHDFVLPYMRKAL